jgi:hypothetical protein
LTTGVTVTDPVSSIGEVVFPGLERVDRRPWVVSGWTATVVPRSCGPADRRRALGVGQGGHPRDRGFLLGDPSRWAAGPEARPTSPRAAMGDGAYILLVGTTAATARDPDDHE